VEPVGGQVKGLSDTLRLLPAIASVTLLSAGNGAPDVLSSVVWPSAEAPSVALSEFENQGGLGDGARAASFGGAAVFLATGPAQVEQVKAAAAALEGIGIGTLASAATAA